MNICDLDFNILEWIAQYVAYSELSSEGTKSLLNLMLTCRKMHKIVKYSQIKVKLALKIIATYNLQNQIETLDKQCQKIRDSSNWVFSHISLYIKSSNSSNYEFNVAKKLSQFYELNFLSPFFEQVTKLDIQFSPGKYYSNVHFDLAFVFSQFKNLYSLKLISNRALLGRFTKTPNIPKNSQLISFTACRIKLFDRSIEYLQEHCPNIAFIDLKNIGYFDYLSTFQILSTFEYLIDLRLRSIASIQIFESLVLSKPLFPNILNLSLQIVEEEEKKFAQALKFHFPNLENLTMNDTPPSILSEFAHTQYAKLNVLKLKIFDSKDLKLLKPIKSLKALHISFLNLESESRKLKAVLHFFENIGNLLADFESTLSWLNISLGEVTKSCSTVLNLLLAKILFNQEQLSVLSIDYTGERVYIEDMLIYGSNLSLFRLGGHCFSRDENMLAQIKNSIRYFDSHFEWRILAQ